MFFFGTISLIRSSRNFIRSILTYNVMLKFHHLYCYCGHTLKTNRRDFGGTIIDSSAALRQHHRYKLIVKKVF